MLFGPGRSISPPMKQANTISHALVDNLVQGCVASVVSLFEQLV